MSDADKQKELKDLIREVVREEIKDLVKTANRIYEDRELYVDVKVRVGTLEDVTKDVVTRLKSLEKNLKADVADVHSQVIEVKEGVKELSS